MKLLHPILFFLPALSFFSCNNQGPTENAYEPANDTTQRQEVSMDRFYTEENDKYGEIGLHFAFPVNRDTLYNELLRLQDTAVHFLSETFPILFFNTGRILSNDQTNAVILSCQTDTTYRLELFSFLNRKWEKRDEMLLESNPVQFDIDFADFNFDGINDLYIRHSITNGYCLSTGHVVTIDRETHKMTLHQELRDLSNLKPHANKKHLTSEEVFWCPPGLKEVCILTHQWRNGKFVQIKKDCPCKGE